MSDDKVMGRAEFFKYLFGKTAQTASEFVEDVVKPIQQAGEIAERTLVYALLPVEEYDGKPRMLTVSKPPVFLAGEVGKNLTAFSALCDKDGYFMMYLPHERALYCGACNSKHVLEFGEEGITTDLAPLPVVVKDGLVCLVRG